MAARAGKKKMKIMNKRIIKPEERVSNRGGDSGGGGGDWCGSRWPVESATFPPHLSPTVPPWVFVFFFAPLAWLTFNDFSNFSPGCLHSL